MAFSRARKLFNGDAGFLGFSIMSRRGITSQTCVIRGEKGDIMFPAEMFETLESHEARFPLVSKIPDGHLINADPAMPYLIADHWRPILFSGLVHSKICKSQKDSIVNAFDYSNVGILKELNVLAFKQFDRQEGKTNVDHRGYSAFLEELFSRLCGISNLCQQFKECADLIEGCENGADEDLLSCSSFFLEEEELANFYCDAHRMIRHEFKHRRLGSKAKLILTELERSYKNLDVVRALPHHKMFRFHLGSHCPSMRKKKVLEGLDTPDYPGTAIVDIHRIAVTHSIEDNLMNNVLPAYPELTQLWCSFSRSDVIKALRYMFPDYPQKVVEAFDRNSLLDKLQMNRRIPTPSICKYVSPFIGNKEDLQGGARSCNS